MARRDRERNLDALLGDPGFSPSFRDVPALLERLGGGEEAAALAERALLRLGPRVVSELVRASVSESAAVRARAARLLGKLGPEGDEARARLVALLGDKESRVRRFAARALGNARSDAARQALAAAWERAVIPADRRALADALGRAGGDAARDALAQIGAGAGVDRELARIGSRARLVLERDEARLTPTTVDARASLDAPASIALHCRDGLEPLVREELGDTWDARVVGPGLVRARLEGPLERAYASRVASSFALVLRPRRPSEDLGADVVAALTSEPARAIFARFTRGPIRYRLAFATGGHRRALVWRIATEVAAKAPELVNDPRASAWEVTVFASADSVRVELAPRALADPRFAYRVAEVAAASHPTVAAALAWVAGVRADDVVWDPFVGSGLELVERARRGPYARMLGTDLEPDALAAAARNVASANVARVALERGDALATSPRGVTLIITNPPMGRRVRTSPADRTGHRLAALLDRFLVHAARVLEPGGRLVWVSPQPDRTRARAREAGLVLDRALLVDFGGFRPEVQRLSKPPRS